MSRKDPEKPKKPASDAEKRKERLAEALRANLRRRKAQAKGRRDQTPPEPDRPEEG